jgi:acyl-coenzyme A thioesterase PaaI-like protein
MKVIYQLIDKLLANPTKMNVMTLDKLLRLGIPFNAPHGFKIQKIDQDEVIISLPNRKLNHNHIGGIHACAMATVGEFCAGVSLLKSFGISKYRLILAEIHINYTYQGRVDLEGSCSPQQINIEEVRKGLEESGKYLQELTTIIRDLKGKEVAQVKTVWQLKNWEEVRTK